MEEARSNLHNRPYQIPKTLRRVDGHKLHFLNLDALLGANIVISAMLGDKVMGRVGQEVAGGSFASVGAMADSDMRVAELIVL